MENISIEVILFGVLIIVIVLDLVIKGRKKKNKKTDDSVMIKSQSPQFNTKKRSSFSLNFLFERSRNIGLYFVSIIVCKVLMTYFFFEKVLFNGRIISKKVFERENDIVLRKRYRRQNKLIDFEFSDYIEFLFSLELIVFAYSFLFVSFIAWQLSPYLKKR